MGPLQARGELWGWRGSEPGNRVSPGIHRENLGTGKLVARAERERPPHLEKTLGQPSPLKQAFSLELVNQQLSHPGRGAQLWVPEWGVQASGLL